jgi:hypothetical protein
MAEAATSADIDDLIQGARDYAATAGTELDGRLKEILDEARADPGLESRIPEAEAYAQ